MVQQTATEQDLALSPQAPLLSEDWLAVGTGLVIFLLALCLLAGVDLLGWATAPRTWVEIGKSVRQASPGYGDYGSFTLLLATYGFVLALLSLAAALLGVGIVRFVLGFSVIYWLSYLAWVLGNYAYIAVTTPADMQRLAIGWSLRLTGESGYLIALLLGLAIANCAPGLARWLSEAARPELYIKTAIVILGGFLAVKAAEQLSLCLDRDGARARRHHRGLSDLLGLGLFRRPQVVRLFARMGGPADFRHLHLRRLGRHRHRRGHSRPPVGADHGVLAGGGLFAMVELLILPFLARSFLADQPLVAAAWMGLAVKTDGAAVASGAVTEALLYGDAAAQGVKWSPGWVVGTTTTIKVFIDIFIGVWSFILAYLWSRHIEPRRAGDELRFRRNLGALSQIRPGLPRHLLACARHHSPRARQS